MLGMGTTNLHCPACHGGPAGEYGHAAMRAIGFAATYTCVSCLSPWRRTRGFDDRYSWEKLGFDPTLFDDAPASVAKPEPRTAMLAGAWKRLVGRATHSAQPGV